MSSLHRMVALHDLCWDFLFSHQMICKQYIILTHMLFPEVILNPLHKQECIPVGCITSATVAICWGGAWSQEGVHGPRGCLLWGGLGPGGCLVPGGAWSWGVPAPGGGIPACTEADPPPWTESQIDVKHNRHNFVADGNKADCMTRSVCMSRLPIITRAFCMAALAQSTLGPSVQKPCSSGGLTCKEITINSFIRKHQGSFTLSQNERESDFLFDFCRCLV